MDKELEKAIYRWDRRRKAFIAEGLSEDEAYDLAEKMFERDRDQPDYRRVCFECKHHVNKLCNAIRDARGRPTAQTRFVLRNCEQFELKGEKK